MGDKFPKHIYHSIVCIGALVAHREDDKWVVDAIGAPHIGERGEKDLVQAFVDKVAGANLKAQTFIEFDGSIKIAHLCVPRNLIRIDQPKESPNVSAP
jgi:hypothetical protein